jgi:hypothetical protein
MEKKEIILIDGYNLLGRLKAKKFDDLEDGRSYLINLSIEYASISKADIMLVFDGSAAEEQKEVIGNVTLIFSRKNQSADQVIEKYVSLLSNSKVLLKVVTADLLQQKFALGKGALRVTPEEFLAQYNTFRDEIKYSGSHVNKKLAIGDIVSEKVKEKLARMLNQ